MSQKTKALLTALLVGSNLEIWASGSDGNISKFQDAGRMITRACGCVTSEGYSIYGVRGATAGILLLKDKKGKIFKPTDPCTRASFRSVINTLADLGNQPQNARLVFAYWDLNPSEVESGMFISSGDTIQVRRP